MFKWAASLALFIGKQFRGQAVQQSNNYTVYSVFGSIFSEGSEIEICVVLLH